MTTGDPQRPSELVRRAWARLLAAVPPGVRGAVARVLGRHGAASLSEAAAGGGALRGDLAGLRDEGAARALAAQLNLGRIAIGPVLNAHLTARGLGSISAIARAPRALFDRAMSDAPDNGAARANEIYAGAGAWDRAMNMRLGGLLAELATGLAPADLPAALPFDDDGACECADCRSAVSPLAYLAELIDYTRHNLLYNDAQLTLPQLEALLHQPFGTLTADCDSMERRVRQVRLCIEVLRHYRASRPPAADPTLFRAERAYRWAAYEALLVRLGLAYPELRRARRSTDEERTVIGERLGIELTDERLNQLLLDQPPAPGQPWNVSEATLERIFGLADTTRNPLSDGYKAGDPGDVLRRWSFSGAAWGRTVDEDGQLYLTVAANDDGWSVTVRRAAGSERNDVVARGSSPTRDEPVTLTAPWPERSGLSGLVEIDPAATPSTAPIVISALPCLLSWRLEHLRELWRDQDFPVDPYAAEYEPAAERLPIIDPDLLGPADFRAALLGPGASPAFDLWLERRAWIDDALRRVGLQRQIEGVAATADTELRRSAEERTGWLRTLEQGGNIAATTRAIGEAGLTVESFTRLMELEARDTAARRDGGAEPLSAAEGREVDSIIVQALKIREFTNWRQAERGRGIALGPDTFWVALDEPREGQWPPLRGLHSPAIDPELIDETETLETGGAPAVRLWRLRREQLDRLYGRLVMIHVDRDFGALLDTAFPTDAAPDPATGTQHWLTAFFALLADLASGNALRHDNALTRLRNLSLTEGQVRQLLELQSRQGGPPEQRPSDADWAAQYHVLADAHRRRHLYPDWRAEESQLPALDPDRIRLEDLPRSAISGRPRVLLARRRGQLDDLLQSLETAYDLGGIDGLVRAALDRPIPEDLLRNTRDLDQQVRQAAELELLRDYFLDAQGLATLLGARDRLAQPPPRPGLSPQERAALVAALASAHKQYTLYPRWAREERRVEELRYWHWARPQFAPWRASPNAYAQWQAALQARSRLPTLDPDLVEVTTTRYQRPHRAYRLWYARRDLIDGWLQALRDRAAAEGRTLPLFDRLLVSELFEPTERAFVRAEIERAINSGGAGAVNRALDVALGLARAELDELRDRLIDPATDREALRRIQLELGFSTRDDFVWSITVGAPPGPADRDRLVRILTSCALVGTVVGPAREQAAGHEITARLGQLGLDLPAYAYLIARREALAANENLLDSEWEDCFAILTQCRKRRAFGAWVAAERAQGLLHGPDDFSLPEPPLLQFPPPEPTPLPAWRATARERRDWLDTLQARYDQERDLIAAYESAVSAAEEEVLPQLRDALIMSLDQGGRSLAGKVRWVTDYLLIEAQADGCQLTTRVAQAIETLQGLLWALRRGLLRQDLPEYTLADEQFDETWPWLGSYEAWRSAVFILLYPENVLLPTLRPQQTPGFRQLVESVGGDRRLSPERAADAARQYSAYLRDVCNLTIQATCSALTAVREAQGLRRGEIGEVARIYMFAVADAADATSHLVYWSARDQGESLGEDQHGSAGYAQSFWSPVAALGPVEAIIGAAPYQMGPEQHYIFLFALRRQKGKRELAFVRFDLRTQSWDAEAGTLDDMPERASEFDVLVCQNLAVDQPPRIVIRLPSEAIYARCMNREGTDWDEAHRGQAGGAEADVEEWTPIVGTQRGMAFARVCAAVAIGPAEFFIVARNDPQPGLSGSINYRLFGPRDDGRWRRVGDFAGAEGFEPFVGALARPDSEDIMVLWNSDPTANTSYRRISRSPGDLLVFPVSSVPALDRWMWEITGHSLAEIVITDPNEYRGLNYLQFFERGNPTLNQPDPPADYEEMLTHYVAWLASGLMREQSERGVRWAFINEQLRDFNADLLSFHEAIQRVVQGIADVTLLQVGERGNTYTVAGPYGITLRDWTTILPLFRHPPFTDLIAFREPHNILQVYTCWDGTFDRSGPEFTPVIRCRQIAVGKVFAGDSVTDGLLCYDLVTGIAQIYRVNLQGQFVAVGNTQNIGIGWTRLRFARLLADENAVQNCLVCYNHISGRYRVVQVIADRSSNTVAWPDLVVYVPDAGQPPPLTPSELVVVGDFDQDGRDELALYSGSRREMHFLSWFPVVGLLTRWPVSTELSEHWSQIVAGHFGNRHVSRLLFYEQAQGLGAFHTVSDGRLEALGAPHANWSIAWTSIVPGRFAFPVGFDDLLFYSRGDQNQSPVRIFTRDTTSELGNAGQFPHRVHTAVPHWGDVPMMNGQPVPNRAARAYRHSERHALPNWYLGLLSFDSTAAPADEQPVTPLFADPLAGAPFQIAARGIAAGTQRQRSERAFAQNDPGPRSNRTYFEEAFCFVPLYLGLQLQRRGAYTAALDWLRTVYDDTAPPDERKIYHGLVLEEGLDFVYRRDEGWLLDLLNPHSVAEQRQHSYTRSVMQMIVRCLLDEADAEFTRDTAESVPRARALYRQALDLLGDEPLGRSAQSCEELVVELMEQLRGPWANAADPLLERELARNLRELNGATAMRAAGGELLTLNFSPADTRNPEQIADTIERQPALAVLGPSRMTISGALDRSEARAAGLRDALLSRPELGQAVGHAATRAGREANLGPRPQRYLPTIAAAFCVPPNPVLRALRLRAELNQYKLRSCRNIAGMLRQLEPYAAPTDTVSGLPTISQDSVLVLPGAARSQPTPYRFAFLVERAKQLAQLAGQIEGELLAAIEKHDREAYEALVARQNAALARQQVRLEQLRVREAEDGIALAELQMERAQIQLEHYQRLLEQGLLAAEQEVLAFMQAAIDIQLGVATLSFIAASIYQGAALASIFLGPDQIAQLQGSAYSSLSAGLSGLAGVKSTQSSYFATVASYERRAQEWELQQRLAQQELRIGAQQVRLAEDRVRVAAQELTIAELRSDHARDVLEYLTGKFTSAELYEWMSGVLEGIYADFLEQATATARLAEEQLAFERHEPPRALIREDYWAPPADLLTADTLGGVGPDRRGLTGAARLLQDIYRLDEYALSTNRRRLQLTKTLSLAHLAPLEFERFRSTGVLPFATPMELFDRDHPGHYLRLIRRVRTTVIALIPPGRTLNATLANSGISRVVAGETFSPTVVRRDPELVVLSGTRDATGLFELDPQQELLLPFEGLGIDTHWELRLPRPANPFDFRTIADVLVTIEYTALHSADYQAQVVARLDTRLSIDRPFSLRSEFPDAWYELHNPDRSETPLQVRFVIRPDDFPPNLLDPRIEHVALYVARNDGVGQEINIDHLRIVDGTQRQERRATTAVSALRTSDGVISTRSGGGAALSALQGRAPYGTWELALHSTSQGLFSEGVLADILIVITARGNAPEWPS